MTVIASATRGLATFHLPAGTYHLGEVAVDALLKNRFSDAYREMQALTTGLISCGSRLLVVANVFPNGAAWSEAPLGETLCRDEGFAIVPVDMMKPSALAERTTISSSTGLDVEVDSHGGCVRLRIDGVWRSLIDEETAVLGRTRGHSLEELARAYDRVRDRRYWVSGFDTTIKGDLPKAEIKLIGHAIEFFTGAEAGVIELDGETIFSSDGLDRDRFHEDSEEMLRVEQAAALLR